MAKKKKGIPATFQALAEAAEHHDKMEKKVEKKILRALKKRKKCDGGTIVREHPRKCPKPYIRKPKGAGRSGGCGMRRRRGGMIITSMSPFLKKFGKRKGGNALGDFALDYLKSGFGLLG